MYLCVRARACVCVCVCLRVRVWVPPLSALATPFVTHLEVEVHDVVGVVRHVGLVSLHAELGLRQAGERGETGGR